MDRVFSETLKVYGIDSRSYGILITLTNDEPLTQIKIGEIVSIDRTTVGQLIDNLESKGYVKRNQNPNDRRQNLIFLTLSGEKLAAKMWTEMRLQEEKVIKNLSDWQKEIILAINNIVER